MAAADGGSVLSAELCAGGTLHLRLARERSLNALDVDAIAELTRVLTGRGSRAMAAVLVTSTGRAFCAGGDVKALALRGPVYAERFLRMEYSLNHLIHSLPCPYLCILDGMVFGGGVGLSIHGRRCLATDRTVWAMPELGIGLVPDVGASFFLPRLQPREPPAAHPHCGPALGLFLALTGHRLKGREVYEAGAAASFVPEARVPRLVEALRCSVWSDQGGVASAVDELLALECAPAPPGAQSPFALLLSQLAPVFLPAVSAGAARPPGAPLGTTAVAQLQLLLVRLDAASAAGAQWAADAAAALRRAPALPLVATLELFWAGAAPGQTLDSCLQRELGACLALICAPPRPGFERNDFAEGVHALLIAKTGAPAWPCLGTADGLQSVRPADVVALIAPVPFLPPAVPAAL
jgi:enoyl-CoA hydratase